MTHEVWIEPFRIGIMEQDPWRRASIQSLCRFFVEAAGKHALTLGIHTDHFLPRGLTWVLSRMHIQVDKYPAGGDRIEVQTWIADVHSYYVFRDFRMLDANSGQLAAATSLWLILDIKTRNPVRVPRGIIQMKASRADRALVEPFTRLPRRPGKALAEKRFQVRLTDLDLNQHVNHLSYFDWSIDSVPHEVWRTCRLEKLGVIFLRETVYGDEIISRIERIDYIPEGEAFNHRFTRQSDGTDIFMAKTEWRRDEEKESLARSVNPRKPSSGFPPARREAKEPIMSQNPYQRLARHLDSLPGGYPASQNGVELRILKRLFTPEEAQLAPSLRLIPETSELIARRAGLSLEDAAQRLADMAAKGLIFRIMSEARPPRYMASQFIIGIWEYQVNHLSPGLARDFEEYMPTFFDPDLWKKIPQMRTIPVQRGLTAQKEVMTYERAEELIEDQKIIVVAPCICRQKTKLLGEECGKPEETCLAFGPTAEYYAHNGLGRYIDKTETLEILHMADKAGLVLQPSNTKHIGILCCCCGCCCQVLVSLKRYPKPGELVSSAYIAAFDAKSCNGCGVCVKRCQMEALAIREDKIVFDPDRCIGCGLCVGACPTHSLALKRKPESEQREIPENTYDVFIKLAKERKG